MTLFWAIIALDCWVLAYALTVEIRRWKRARAAARDPAMGVRVGMRSYRDPDRARADRPPSARVSDRVPRKALNLLKKGRKQ